MAEEIKEEIKTESKSGKRRISWKAIGIAALAVILLAGGIYGGIRFSAWRNNGLGYAEKLSEQIGVSAATAQKYARVNLQSASEFACINMAAAEYPHLYESTRTTQVMGVTIPEWVIYIGETNNTVTDVIYYNYKQLQNYGTGIKTDAHIGTEGITIGMTPDAVQTYVGFAPLCTAYSDKGMTESYKYYFKDQNTGDTISYIMTVTYEDELVTSVSEEENYFILSVLSVS